MMAGAQATTIVYTSGHAITIAAATAGGVTLAGSNPSSGFNAYDGSSFAAAIGDGATGTYGAYDAVVIGESGLGASEKVAFASYISGGGHGVVLGAHGNEDEFLNTTFGFTTTGAAVMPSSSDSGPIDRVAGTGPLTLAGLNGSWYLSKASLPVAATILYDRSEPAYADAAAAFVMNYGAGTLSWLAWDFCDCGGSLADQTDWYLVLGQEAVGEGVPEPVSIVLLGLGLAGLGFGRKRSQSQQMS